MAWIGQEMDLSMGVKMLRRVLGRVIWILGLSYCLISGSARATVSNDAVWNGLFLQGPLLGSWGFFVEQQLRLNDASDLDSLKLRGNRWILRPALVWNAPSLPGLQLFIGAAHTPNLSPVRGEDRLWEQVQYSMPYSGGKFVQRLRLEQRHIERTEGLAHRGRLQLRTASQVSVDSPWGWALSDEVFYNFNTVAGGPKAGFDQNRIFIGPQYQVDRRSRIESGYLQSWIAQGAARDSQINHALVLFWFVDFTS